MNESFVEIIRTQLYQELINSTQKGTIQIFENYARVIAGAGAMLYIASRLIGQVSRNEPIDFFPLLRPFAIALLIGSLGRITNAIDAGADSLVSAVTQNGNSTTERIAYIIKQREKAVEDKLKVFQEQQTENDSGGDESWSETFKSLGLKFSTIADYTAAKIDIALQEMFQNLLVAICNIAEGILYLISILFRIVLRIIGPIAIALAIFDGFTGNIAEWFGKYINFSLLPVVANIYGIISFKIHELYLTNYSPAGQTNESLTGDGFLGYGYLGLLVLILIGYFQVPAATNLILSVGGVGGITQGISNYAQAGYRSMKPPLDRASNKAQNMANKVQTSTRFKNWNQILQRKK